VTDRAVSRETPRLVAVVGTGTEVGKTHASVALVAALAAEGRKVCGLKPIESGVSPGVLTDAARLAAVSSAPCAAAPYQFEAPVSPHLAARSTGVTISVEAAARWVLDQVAEVLVVETAGALLSPLGPGLTNLDLVRALRPDALVLVGLDRLGILHEVAACQVALRALAPELPEPVVVLNAPAVRDASSGTNAGELRTLGVVSRVVGMPRGESLEPESLRVMGEVVGWVVSHG